MKAFFLLVFLFLFFLLLSSTSIASVDLTPGDGDIAAAPAALASEPQVITIQDSPPVVFDEPPPQVPVTGTCSDPYTVQPGEVLSSIAVICNTTVAEIRQANPQITNANLIYPGQQLRIPGATSVSIPSGNMTIPGAATPLPTVALPEQVILATPQIEATLPFTLDTTAPTVVVPVTGPYQTINAGTGLQVKGLYFPPNTPVNISIGPDNGTFTVVAAGQTDASGNVTTTITIPASTDNTTPWVVLVSTNGARAVQARSERFLVGPVQ